MHVFTDPLKNLALLASKMMFMLQSSEGVRLLHFASTCTDEVHASLNHIPAYSLSHGESEVKK